MYKSASLIAADNVPKSLSVLIRPGQGGRSPKRWADGGVPASNTPLCPRVRPGTRAPACITPPCLLTAPSHVVPPSQCSPGMCVCVCDVGAPHAESLCWWALWSPLHLTIPTNGSTHTHCCLFSCQLRLCSKHAAWYCWASNNWGWTQHFSPLTSLLL